MVHAVADAGFRLRILVVEDDPRIGQILTDMLEDADFEVDGPYARLDEGVAAVARHFPDFALLDIRLGKQDVTLLADDLNQYGIGFAFCSGAVARDRMVARFPQATLLSKPLDSNCVLDAVRKGAMPS